MTNWREIERIRKDPRGFRDLAARLQKTVGFDWLTDWESSFLESICRARDVEEFTTRQGEKLLEIRDGRVPVDTIGGFSVKALIRGCHEARLDLSEDDEVWIMRVRERGADNVLRRDAGHLMRCARQLGLIEAEVSA